MHEDRDIYHIEPTSRDSAECDPIILRQTTTTRLVFIPLLINSQQDIEAAVKGEFVYQRKGPNDEWEDVEKINLSSLKKGEGVSLQLKTEEVLKLFRDLAGLYELHSLEGIPKQPTIYLKTNAIETGSLELDSKELNKLLSKLNQSSINTINQLLDWITGFEDVDHVLQQLQLLDIDNLERLNTLATTSSLQRILSIWRKNKKNSNEEFWQQTIAKLSFTLSHVFTSPVIILQEKGYVGGKTINNQQGKVVDYIVKNDLTHNTALVEIKTPTTPLLRKESYREGIFAPSIELSGAITL